MRLVLAFFILVPLIEMAILIEVGSVIGALPTVALVVLTATIGIWLLRLEGTATLAKVQDKMNRGQLPGTELLEGVMLLVGGALLLTPGFVTDTIGFVCLIPLFRHPIANWLISRGIMSFAPQSGSFSSSTIIEGEFEEQKQSSIDKQPRNNN
ncbi:MAG: FxsA family protein [Pseudomonadales bacterium]|nr:FxsA family protein [Pseudomonadales bacterium]